MAYPFPVGYQPIMYNNPNPYQQQPIPQYNQQQQQAPQMLTPPTIHAEIVQVDNETAAANYPVGAGASQMMISRDESAIFIKTATQGGFELTVFEKRPPAPPAPAFDPSLYVRRDELADLMDRALKGSAKTSEPV